MFASANSIVEMITEADLIERIDQFLLDTGMAPTRFGREAANEPAFVTRLRGGMSPTLGRVNRVIAFMDQFRAERDADHIASLNGADEALSPDTSIDSIGAAA
jgi:hypothetical protein